MGGASNNLRDIILSYDSVTLINGTLIKDIGNNDTEAFCCYSLAITSTCNIKSLHPTP